MVQRRLWPAVALVLLYASPAQSGYVFTLLAKSGDTIGGKTLTNVGTPRINDTGMVAFGAGVSGGTGLFTPTSKLAATGDVIGGRTLGSVGTFTHTINNMGQVFFQSQVTAGGGFTGIFTPTAKVIVDGETIGGKTIFRISSAQVLSSNDAGVVAFSAYLPGSGPLDYDQIFTQNEFLVERGGMIAGMLVTGLGDTTAIDASGRVAFQAFGIGFNNAIATASEILVRRNDVIDGYTLTGLGDPTTNGSDLVFRSLTSLGQGIFRLDRKIAHTGDTIDGLTLSSFADLPKMNDLRETVFFGEGRPFPGGSIRQAIFTQSEIVAAVGDSITGRTLTGLLSSPWINNQGDIVFTATFSGGSGVFLATPTPGTNEATPIVPTSATAPWDFSGVAGNGQWFDPTPAFGFKYQTDGQSNFVMVGMPMSVPDDDGLYTVTSILGSVDLAPGQMHTFSSPVSAFTVTGIDPAVDGDDPQAFPTFLKFDEATVSFTMTPLVVPEPSCVFLAVVGLCWLPLPRSVRRRT